MRVSKWVLINFIVFKIILSSVGYSQNQYDLESIEKRIDVFMQYFSEDNPGAVVSYFHEGNIVFNKAYGLANKESGERLSVDHTFDLADISKVFTSVAVMKLVEKRKLNLDNTLYDIFPDFPDYGKKVKIRNLLNHTSGIPDFNIDECNSNKEVYEFLLKQDKLIFEPNSDSRYSNSDYVLLAIIIEKQSGLSFDDFFKKYIFKKVSMTNTSLNSLPSSKAKAHFKINDEYIPKESSNKIYGEQGIYSNSLDMAKFDKALYSNKILKCESLSQIFSTDSLYYGKKVFYNGFGWVLMEKNGVRYYWHGGSSNGYTNLILHLPDSKSTVLILTNRNDGYDFLRLSIFIAKLFDKNLKL